MSSSEIRHQQSDDVAVLDVSRRDRGTQSLLVVLLEPAGALEEERVLVQVEVDQ
jgi:hypothetical protein